MQPAPLPIRAAEFALQRLPYPVLTVGGVLMVVLLIYQASMGMMFPTDAADLWGDKLEMTGVALLMSVMPPYLLMCFIASLRISMATYRTLRPLLDDETYLDRLQYRFLGFWPLAMLIGLANGLYSNINHEALDYSNVTAAKVSIAIITGQGFMWCIVGIVLFFRFHQGIVLHKLAAHVKIDLYNLDKLNGFGRESLNSFLMLAGALALTTLQSISLEFDFSNYANAFIVAIPAVLILVPLPIWAIHRRIVAAKRQHVVEINREMENSSRSLDEVSLLRMNALLHRRELVQSLRNWPMDLSILFRFGLYVFIVPLAWAGAAFTEVFLDAILGL